MPNRIIKESICVSEQIDELTPFEEITFYRLLVNCDDYGCFDAREKVLLSRLFPLRDIKTAEIQKAMQKLARIGLIQLYKVGGKPFLNVCKWGEHQRLRVSKHKYPTPEDADDCEKLPQVAASCRQMPLESESEYESNTNTNREPQKRFTPPTVEEVAAYCKERNNGINPQYFVDYHIARDWVLSNGKKMKDWKATIRTWEGNNYNRNKPVKVLPAQNFPQRDYKDVDAKMLDELAAEVAEFNKGAG